MGLFSRKPKVEPVIMYLIDEKADDYFYDIVGESRCYDHLRQLIRQAPADARDACEIETLAELVPEPTNEFDPNAIEVWISGGRVGYIGRTDAPAIHGVLNRAWAAGGARAILPARIGWNGDYADPLIGVRLRLSDDLDGVRPMTREQLEAESQQ
jgi:hypothetical protein